MPAGAYDAVIHVLGNSVYHAETWRSLLRNGGTVWLHEANLAGMYLPIAQLMGSDDRAMSFMSERLEACYGARVPWELLDGRLLDYGRYVELGLAMTGEALRAASQVILNSERAKALCRADVGSSFDLLRRTVMPHAFAPMATRWQPNPNVERWVRPVVVSCGWLSRVKQPELIIEAIALLPAPRRPLLVFVGPSGEMGLREDLFRLADARGVSDLVAVTGRVSDADYANWLSMATGAVQLRAR